MSTDNTAAVACPDFLDDALDALSEDEFDAGCEPPWADEDVLILKRHLGLRSIDPRRTKSNIGKLLRVRVKNLDEEGRYHLAHC